MKPKPKITLTRKQLKAFQTHLNRVCATVYRIGEIDGKSCNKNMPLESRQERTLKAAKAIWLLEGWVQKNLV